MFQQDIQKFDINVLHKTPEGYYQGTVIPTGIGVFKYYAGNGKYVQRLRDVDDVKAATASLNCKPITLQHPNVPVDVNNVKELQVGMTANDASFDGLNNRVTVTITNKDAIDAIDRKEVKAFSMGYKCNVVDNDGVWQGVHHDQQQKDIVYNHLALVTKGRAGDKVNFMVGDSADFADYFDMAEPESTGDGQPEKIETVKDGKEFQDGRQVVVNDGKPSPDVILNDNNMNTKEQSMKTIQLDGVDYQADEKVVDALQAAQKDAAEKIDEIHTLLSAVDERDSQIAELKEQLDAAENEIDEDVIDAAVNAKLEILENAKAAGIECDSSDDVSGLKREIVKAAFDGIDIESIEDEASLNALYISASKVIADKAEKGGCGGKGGTKKNPAAQFDGPRNVGDGYEGDSLEDKLMRETIALSNGKKKED